MSTRMFTYTWVYGGTGQKKFRVELGRAKSKKKWTKYDNQKGFPAAILYPSLFTPDILVEKDQNDRLELLLAMPDIKLKARPGWFTSVSDDEFQANMRLFINRQLKIVKGLNLERRYKEVLDLFPFESNDNANKEAEYILDEDLIRCERLGELKAKTLYKTETRFEGFVHQSAVAFYRKHEFTHVLSVSIAHRALDNECVPEDEDPAMTTLGVCGRYDGKDKKNWRRPLPYEGWQPKLHYEEEKAKWNPDYLVFKSVENGAKSMNLGRYGFKVQAEDIRVGELDKNNPVQTFHPVFVYDDLSYARIGHMADIHINSRQQILSRCRAKVIEHKDFKKTIGEMVNISSRNVKELLTKFGGGDKEVDAIVISGDLVDFNHNAIMTGPPDDNKLKVKEIWDLVDMKLYKNYKDWVDYLALYSLVIDFYGKTEAKPIFVVTGNHDCYYEAFSISPRTNVFGEIRANSGIPADHNLTIYESILCFGPTYHRLEKSGFTHGHFSSFWAEKFSWFHTVFTPFSDFVVRLPRQNLVGLGWGHTEDMMTPGRGHEAGHLPRASDSLSSKQLRLLDSATQENKRNTIAISHFTFVNYYPNLTNQMAMEGTLGDQSYVHFTRDWIPRLPKDEKKKTFSKADIGTFENNRTALYKDYLLGRKIQISLAGHTHRRGLYTIRKKVGSRSLETGFYDFPNFLAGKPDYVKQPGQNKFHWIGPADKRSPWLIVCDSGGSISCINLADEFMGNGREPPGGARIVFKDDTGEVETLEVVPVLNERAQPRFVVALDFMDIEKMRVIKNFGTQFSEADIKKKAFKGLVFKLEWEEVPDSKAGLETLVPIPDAYGFDVKEINLYYGSKKDKCLEKVGLKEGRNNAQWLMSPEDSKLLHEIISKKKGRSVFLSMVFARRPNEPLLERYEFGTPWTFEVKIKASKVKIKGSPIKKKQRRYVLDRYEKCGQPLFHHSHWREFPDLKRHEKMAMDNKDKNENKNDKNWLGW